MVSSLRVALLSFLIILSSTLSAQRNFRDQDPVPPDHGKAPGTLLLVRTPEKNVNKPLQDVFAEYYKGPFEVINLEDLQKPEYAELDTYRNLFNTVIKFVPASGMGDTRMPVTNDYTYNVLDRATGRPNGPTFDGGALKGLMKEYAKKLEDVRAGGKQPAAVRRDR